MTMTSDENGLDDDLKDLPQRRKRGKSQRYLNQRQTKKLQKLRVNYG